MVVYPVLLDVWCRAWGAVAAHAWCHSPDGDRYNSLDTSLAAAVNPLSASLTPGVAICALLRQWAPASQAGHPSLKVEARGSGRAMQAPVHPGRVHFCPYFPHFASVCPSCLPAVAGTEAMASQRLFHQLLQLHTVPNIISY